MSRSTFIHSAWGFQAAAGRLQVQTRPASDGRVAKSVQGSRVLDRQRQQQLGRGVAEHPTQKNELSLQPLIDVVGPPKAMALAFEFRIGNRLCVPQPPRRGFAAGARRGLRCPARSAAPRDSSPFGARAA